MSGMEPYVAFMLILFVSNVLGAVGGFGAGLISIPFLTQIFDTKTVVMTSTMTCVLNIAISLKGRSFINWRELFRIFAGMCIGLPIGVYGLKMIAGEKLKLILGVFMVLLGIYGLLKLRIPGVQKYKFPQWALWLCLVAGGIVQGAISSGGCFVLLYAQEKMREKRQFRATLALLWTIVSLVTILQYLAFGTLTKEATGLFFLGAPAVLAGIAVGGKLCGKLNQTAFLYLINSVIIGAGCINCISLMK